MASTSRLMEVMNGSTISASTSPAVSMPMPMGGPLNRGSPPATAFRAGCTWSCMKGAKTNRPHMPKMMLGMAASSSMAPPTGRASQGGASSTRNRAISRLMGTAITRAMAVDTRVPKMLLRAPKSPVTGFQAWLVRNCQPSWWRASADPDQSCRNTPPSSTRIRTALAATTRWAARSPVSRRRRVARAAAEGAVVDATFTAPRRACRRPRSPSSRSSPPGRPPCRGWARSAAPPTPDWGCGSTSRRTSGPARRWPRPAAACA